MESRTKNSSRNIFYGVLQKIISLVFPFIVRSAFIYKLGKEYLGLDSLFTSLLLVLSLAELGFGKALVYSMYKPIADEDNEKICALLNFYKKCYRIIGIIILIIGLIVMPFLRYFISGDYPADINIYIAYFIFLINTVISYFLFAYKSSLLVAYQRMDIGSKVTLILNIVKYGIQLLVLVFLKNYYLYLIIIPILTIINNIAVSIISNKLYPNCQAHGNIEKKELKIIVKNVKGMFLQKIGGIAMKNADNIVISSILGLSILGIYNNYIYIIAAVTGFLDIILESIKPSVGNSIVRETKEKNYEDFNKFNFMYLWIATWSSACFACLMNDFIYLWLGSEMLLPKYICIIFCIYFYVHHWCAMLYVYQESKGLWWENRYTQLITAMVNFALNIILVKIIGIAGILLATIITVLLITGPGYCIVLFKKYFNNKGYLKEYLLNQLRHIITTTFVVSITYYICDFFNNISITTFVMKIFICIIVPNIIFIIFNLTDKNFKKTLKFIREKIFGRLIYEKN